MEWSVMEPYSSANGGLGCLVDDIYLPADNCQGENVLFFAYKLHQFQLFC